MRIVLVWLSVSLSAACAGSQPAPAAPRAPDGPSIVITPDMGSPHVGEAAPDFELRDQDGRPLRLSSLRGGVVVLSFVASFCPYSTAEQPHLAAMAAAYADRNVRFVAVNVKEPEAKYREYLARVPMGFPVLHDTTGDVSRSYAPPGAQPTFRDRAMAVVTSNLVIDREGIIRFFTIVDTLHFDAELVHARRAVDRLLTEQGG